MYRVNRVYRVYRVYKYKNGIALAYWRLHTVLEIHGALILIDSGWQP